MMEKQALGVSMILNICLGSFKPELNMAQPIMTNSKVPRSKLTLFNRLVCEIRGVDERQRFNVKIFKEFVCAES